MMVLASNINHRLFSRCVRIACQRCRFITKIPLHLYIDCHFMSSVIRGNIKIHEQGICADCSFPIRIEYIKVTFYTFQTKETLSEFRSCYGRYSKKKKKKKKNEWQAHVSKAVHIMRYDYHMRRLNTPSQLSSRLSNQFNSLLLLFSLSISLFTHSLNRELF